MTVKKCKSKGAKLGEQGGCWTSLQPQSWVVQVHNYYSLDQNSVPPINLDWLDTPDLANQVWIKSGEMENMQCCVLAPQDCEPLAYSIKLEFSLNQSKDVGS